MHDLDRVTDQLVGLYDTVLERLARGAVGPSAEVPTHDLPPALLLGDNELESTVLPERATTTTPRASPWPASGSSRAAWGAHSVIYGIGGLVSRVIVMVLLPPLYTRYLDARDYGQIETLLALTTVMGLVLRAASRARSSASTSTSTTTPDACACSGHRSGSRWARARSGWRCSSPSPSPSQRSCSGTPGGRPRPCGRISLWATVNYEQLTALFRVEERSLAFVSASLANVLITIGLTLLVVALEKGALGVIVGNFSGTLIVYLALLGYRREQLGLQFDRGLLREMNRFGLVPTALFLWVTNFSDRFFLVKLADVAEAGLYSVGVRIASAMVLLLTAFRLAWPAFAYSIADDDEARRTYAYVLTYLTVVTGWVALALTLLSPWIVDVLATPGSRAGASSARSRSRRSRTARTSSSRSASGARAGPSSTGSSPGRPRRSTSRSTLR